MTARRLSMRLWIAPLLVVAAILASACGSESRNVIVYRLQRAMGTAPGMQPRSNADPGALEGIVVAGGVPLAGARVVAAEPDGTPHSDVSDASGRYRIEGLPPGRVAPAAVAPGMAETTIAGGLVPWNGVIASGGMLEAPPLVLEPHHAPPLAAARLEITARSVVTTVYPQGARAQRTDGSFTRAGVRVDTFRFFEAGSLPPGQAPPPLLLLVYPSFVDGWQDVSAGLAASGYGVAAISPMAERGVDMDAHAQDARAALVLARSLCAETGACAADAPAIVLAGSFSSAIAYRLLRDEGDAIRAWITVGGIADAFSGTADYYAGRITLPPWHADAIPALGPPHLQPLPFLRYSPVFNAADLPPTLIIHTAADEVIPIGQARALEQALVEAGVPVEAFYYEDTTHYLQIGAQMTEAGRAMFGRVLDFVARQQ